MNGINRLLTRAVLVPGLDLDLGNPLLGGCEVPGGHSEERA